MRSAVVVGAGVGGLTAAVALQRRGWRVAVSERAAALEHVGAGIAIQPNALRALDTVGLGQRVRELSAIQGDAGLVRRDGRWLSRTNAEFAARRFGDPTVLLHRAVLIDILAGALTDGSLRLDAEVEAVDPETGRVTVGGDELAADLVVAADGINSRVRRTLLPEHPGPVYAGVTSWRMLVPAPPGPVRASESWGRGEVFGIGAVAGGQVYCYATAVCPPGGRAPDERAELLRRFGGWHPPIPQLLRSATEVLRTDIYCLDEPLPRFHAGRVALLGDAAHAMTPNLGQGACQAIEDAVVLAHHAAEPDGLARYSAARVPRTTLVARRSRRIGRLTRFTSQVAVAARDGGVWLAGRLGDSVVIRQVAPVLDWRPPA